MKMTRRRVRMALLLAVAGFILLNGVAWMHARAMTRFVSAGQRTAFPEQLSLMAKARVLLTGVTVPRPVNRRTPGAVGLPFVSENYVTHDGYRLGSWRITAASAPVTVVMYHGYAGSKADLLDEAVLLHRMGVDLVLVDFRGSGESTGDRTTIGVDEATDAAAVFNAIQRSSSKKRIVLLGQSMGAAAVLRAVAIHALKPDGLILEAPFDRLVTTIGNRFTAMGLPATPFDHLLVLWGSIEIGANGFTHNPADYATQVRCPTLVLNGDRDRRVSVEQVRHVYDGIAGQRRLKIFSDTGHLLYTKNHASEWEYEVRRLLSSVAPSLAPP